MLPSPLVEAVLEPPVPVLLAAALGLSKALTICLSPVPLVRIHREHFLHLWSEMWKKVDMESITTRKEN